MRGRRIFSFLVLHTFLFILTPGFEAAHIFLDAFQGMEKKDDVLLRAVFAGKKTAASSSEFFLKVSFCFVYYYCLFG